jgi:type IV pilus assembly protein PilQ
MMIQRTSALAFVIAGISLPHVVFAKAAGSIAVERIETKNTGSEHEIVIHTSKDATFSVFRLSDPFRVLVDVNDATVKEPIELIKLKDGVIRYVATNTFADETSAIVRIEIALESTLEYRVRAEGQSIVVHVEHAKGKNAPAVEPAAATQPAPKAEAAKPVVESKDEAPAAQETKALVRIGAVQKKAEKSRTVLFAKIEQGKISQDAIHIEKIDAPSRLVIDVAGAEIQPKWQKLDVKSQGVKRARIGTADGAVRFVLDLNEGKETPRVDVDSVDGKLVLALSRPKAEVKQAEAAPITEAEPEAHALAQTEAAPAPAAAAPAPRATSRIGDVRFEPKDGFMRLTVVLQDGDSAIEKDAQGVPELPMLRIKGAYLPQSYERTLDVSEVAGQLVTTISTYRDGGDTIIAAQIGRDTEHRHWRKDNRLMWDFRARAGAKPMLTKADTRAHVLAYPEQATSGFGTQASQLASITLPQAQQYKGRRISLDLKDADIQNVLRLLADVSKLNIVAADDVKGKVTIKLRNVPWDQALDIILRSKQLDKTRVGNIIRVAPVDVLRKEEELRIERAKARVELEPLAVRLIPVSYAVATEIKPQVTALLSPRGKVNIDTRTNVLVVEDIAEVLLKVERLVRTLDTQTPQVLIEARIVEANTSFSRTLGIQWGGTVSASQEFGTSTGLSFPNNIHIAGASDDAQTPTAGVLASGNNFAVNLPAQIGTGSGGGLGFIFGSAGGAALLSVRLSAFEQVGKIKIISAPKVVTLDNKQAKIISGERVPITVITANGPTTRFIEANLELGVTPHVTQDGSILLNVSAHKNELSARRDILGTPGILTKEAETEMLVRDGDTAVLGGIYKRNATATDSYVPFLGRIPVLGWIFKSTAKVESREELLIFISPRIVNRSQALVSAQ